MRVLIEEQYYPASLVKDICGDFGQPNKEGDIKISRVGYFFNHKISDCVICLPKVVMFKKNGKYSAFGKCQPSELVNLCSNDVAYVPEAIKRDTRIVPFIKDFSLWSYRTISTFARLNTDSDIVYKSSSSIVDDKTQGTLLDVILMLIKFYNENREYFMYIIKNIHSGYNRVNWRQTISKKTPILQSGIPVYMEVVNRKKQINFDEELMVIFYSILNHIKDQLGFEVHFECNYDLIRGAEFQSYIEELGLIRLAAIKYKYFSDKDLEMWNLCHAFFERTRSISSSDNAQDYLFVSDFDKVFESMMNALITDSNIPKKLVDQKDGKLVDHIFMHKSPLDGTDVYYIGDSKYYKADDSLDSKSLYKQYTYAKNVIQFHFDKNVCDADKRVQYREGITEGYTFTPNFFISAYIPNDLSYEQKNISQRDPDSDNLLMTHFDNRLFDRDTLWLSHFDVNLLYVMGIYARDDSFEKSSFKKSFKDKVHKGFQDMLKAEYYFFWVVPHTDVDEFVMNNFYYLSGRVYIPYKEKERILLAIKTEHIDDILPKVNMTLKDYIQDIGADIIDILDLNLS
jgi:hypothetical protein